ncbi:MAG: membrane protein insertion efficiency factor YidD [Candidatus Latescibacterota bacterium]
MAPSTLARRLDRMLAGAAGAGLWTYQALLSPLKGVLLGQAHTCRFDPTCSTYARQCFRVHPVPRAACLALRRLLRCHPFHPGGYDPVPAAGSGQAAPAAACTER